jgi:hypothetical protein
VSDETGAEGTAGEHDPVRRTLDACLFAPIGVAMTIKEDLPGLIDKGRSRVEQEISNARVAGEYVVGRYQRRFLETLDSIFHNDDPSATPTREEPVAGNVAPSPAATRPAPDVADTALVGAALADYDTLSASQVVRRLESLGPEELRAVQRYEAATRNRRTILNRAGQLLEPGHGQAASG